MKTWEMLKELTENPEKKFRRSGWGDGRYITAMSTGLVVDENCRNANVNRLKVDWEMLPQEVTWQEAIEAWANGKDIKSIVYGEEIFYRSFKTEGYLEDQNGDAISFDELTEGKWYIL